MADIKCDVCNVSWKKIGKHKLLCTKGAPQELHEHLKVAYKIQVKNFICKKDYFKYTREVKSRKKQCCKSKSPERKKPKIIWTTHQDSANVPKTSDNPQTDNKESGASKNQSVPAPSPLKTVSKTNSRCIVCRKRVAAGCTTIPKDAQIDFLIRYQTLIPDGCRICKKHLIGKHLKSDITPLSIEKAEMSNEKMQQALSMLLGQRESKSSPINFDGEMNYHTWTGTFILV